MDLSIEPIAKQLLGEPNQRLSSKTEWRYGNRGSLSIDLNKGQWFDHETNQGGGILDLITWQTGLEGTDRSQWLREHGHANGKDRGTIVAIYDYTDEVGKLLFQVVRFDPKDFRQRKPDGSGWAWTVKGVRQIPYRLPDLRERIDSADDKVPTVFVVEGEKDADRLWSLGLAATTNAGGAGKWRPELSEYLKGADVVVIPDYDPQKRNPKTNELMWHEDGRPVLPGQDHAQDVAASLTAIGIKARVLELWKHWPEMPLKADVSDWLRVGGGNAVMLYELAAQTPLWMPGDIALDRALDLIAPLRWEDESNLAVRDWKSPGLFLAKHVTVVVAPSGSGKSLLTLQLSIAASQGQTWAGWRMRGKMRVLIINSEDDIDEIQRRLMAASKEMTFDTPFDVDAYLANIRIMDATRSDAVIAKFEIKEKKLKRVEPKYNEIVRLAKELNADIIIVDPFAETFEGDENSNSELKWAGIYWRDVARATGAAVCLVHHTKKYATGMAGDVDAARGAGALIGIARIVSTLFPMTTKEAEVMLDRDKQATRSLYLRYDDAKANLNMVSPFARWFWKKTVTLKNAKDGLPGDDVGVLVPWKPTEYPSVLEAQIMAFFVRVDQGIIDENGNPTGEFYTFEKRGSKAGEVNRFIGDFAKEFFETTELKAAAMIEEWRTKNRLRNGPSYKSNQKNSRHLRKRVISELNPIAIRADEEKAKTEEKMQEQFF